MSNAEKAELMSYLREGIDMAHTRNRELETPALAAYHEGWCEALAAVIQWLETHE